MNTTTSRTDNVNPYAHVHVSASALLASAAHLLRRIGVSEASNDSIACALIDIERIANVLSGRAVSLAREPLPLSADGLYAAMSAPISMPPFARPETTASATVPNGASKAPAPIDPPTPDDDDEFDGPNTVECDDDTSTVEVCGKCKGKGTWRFGRPCPDCVPQVEPDAVVVKAPAPVATVAANKPVAAALALTTDDVDDDLPVIGYDDVPEGYTIRVQAPIMRTGKPLHVVEYDDEQLYDDYSPTKALAFAQKHAIDNGRARRAPRPAPTTLSQKLPITTPTTIGAMSKAPALRQGNSSAPLNAPAPAPKASAPAAPASAKPAGKPTPVAPAPVVVAPPANVSNGVNTDHVNRATEALDKGSIKALALACAVIGLPAKASDGAKVMREALADWLLANDDVDADDEQGSEPVAAVAPAPVASKPVAPVKPAAPARKPAAAPKTVDASETGGLPLNMWRMLLAVDAADGAPLTYAEIRDMLISEFGVNYYSGMTAALREAKPDSLSDRGLVAESLVDVDGRSKFAFTITAAGRALVAKHS